MRNTLPKSGPLLLLHPVYVFFYALGNLTLMETLTLNLMKRVGRNNLKAIRHRAKTLSQKKERIKNSWTFIEWDSDPLSDRLSNWILYAYYSNRAPWHMMQKLQCEDPWHSWQVASYSSVWRCMSYRTLRTERQSCGRVCGFETRDLKKKRIKMVMSNI